MRMILNQSLSNGSWLLFLGEVSSKVLGVVRDALHSNKNYGKLNVALEGAKIVASFVQNLQGLNEIQKLVKDFSNNYIQHLT